MAEIILGFFVIACFSIAFLLAWACCCVASKADDDEEAAQWAERRD